MLHNVSWLCLVAEKQAYIIELKTNFTKQNSAEILPKTAIEQNHCYKPFFAGLT